jgi:hypothetical protein
MQARPMPVPVHCRRRISFAVRENERSTLHAISIVRLSLRFIPPLALVLGLFAYAVVPLMDNLTLRWFVRDLDIRS